MAVAELLRHTRECRRLTLEQLAAETRIPLDRLASFEREGLAPDAGFYHRAWIRGYAHALGLDEPAFLRELNQDLAAAAPRATAPAKRSGPVRRWPLLAALGCVVAAAFIASALRVSREQRPEPAPTRRLSDPVVAAVHNERTAAPTVPASLATGGIVESDVPLPTPAVVSAPTVTQLVITSKPDGARVTVDGIGWGPTPVTIRHLPEGVKRIRVTHDGYAGAERQVEVQPDRVNRVSVQLRSLPHAGE